MKLLALALALLLAGCTRNAARRSVMVAREGERTRELIQGAKLSNQFGRERLLVGGSNSVERALVAYDLVDGFLGRAQSIVGLPIVDQTEVVSALLSELKTVRAGAEAGERDRIEQEQGWARERAISEQKLLELGAKYEAERNKSLVKRFWRWLVSSVGIGGVVALCVFCPAAIPIIARVLAWVAGKIPALAGLIGVVSTKAFDSAVRGIQRAKEEFAKEPPEAHAEVLATSLSKEMDREHKDLVAARLPTAVKTLAVRRV
jgi:hypothetical protein